MSEGEIDDRFAAIARDLQSQLSERSTVDRITALALEIVEGCNHAGISLVGRHNKVTTVAPTDDVVRQGDQWQYDLGEGPCLDSIRQEQTIYSARLADESRWPRWSSEVSEKLGIHSMLCFQLFTTEQGYGALNLYSDRDDAFDHHDADVGLALAAHAAVALASSRKMDQLNTALANRTLIGQAEGILMERFTLAADQAFAVLTRVSQQRNRRVVEIARELVDTRATPGGSKPSPS